MKRLFSYLGAALVISLMLVNPAYAATGGVAPSTANGSSGLSITPRKNLNIRPGTSVADKLIISNLDSKKNLTINLKVIDFTFTDETGTPKLMLADNAPQTTWSLKPFITLPQNISIPAGQTKTVNYSVKIPAGYGAGSYYSALQYAATDTGGGNVSLSASGVTLVFVSVPGVVKEDLKLKKFGAYQSNPGTAGGKYVYIATNKPEQIAFTLKNSGNVAEAPVGSITYKHMFGKKKVIGNVNPTSSLALREQARLFTTCFERKTEQVNLQNTSTTTTNCKAPKLLPGHYSATLDVFYGQNGNKSQEITGSAGFWYLPFWFIAVVVAIITAIAFAGWRVYRKIRSAINGDNKTYKKSYKRKKRR